MPANPGLTAPAPAPASQALLPVRLLRGALTTAIRALPRRRRFGCCVRLSQIAAPLLRRLWARGPWTVYRVETPAEFMLTSLLNALHRAGVEFDPDYEVEGDDHLQAALQARDGTLLVGPHTMLSALLVRRIHDAGRGYAVLAVSPVWRLLGTRDSIRTLQQSRVTLLAVRACLARGDIVCTMLDKKPAGARDEPRRVETSSGPLLLDDGLFHVAARAGAGVLFTAARLDRGRLRVRVQPASNPSLRSGAALTAEFVAFVSGHVAATRTR